ncbi:hypothetical protein D3C79_144550 [compost metagenome]
MQTHLKHQQYQADFTDLPHRRQRTRAEQCIVEIRCDHAEQRRPQQQTGRDLADDRALAKPFGKAAADVAERDHQHQLQQPDSHEYLGKSDTDTNLVAASPSGPAAPYAMMTVTPLARFASAWRNDVSETCSVRAADSRITAHSQRGQPNPGRTHGT